MNTETAFEDFLDKVVNLNKSRVERIEDAQRILSEFIHNQDDFKGLYIDTIPQGSYRQDTIIKPVGDDLTHPLIYAARARGAVRGLFWSISENFSISGWRRVSGMVGIRS